MNEHFCSSVEGFGTVSQGKFEKEILKTSAILGLQADKADLHWKSFLLGLCLTV